MFQRRLTRLHHCCSVCGIVCLLTAMGCGDSTPAKVVVAPMLMQQPSKQEGAAFPDIKTKRTAADEAVIPNNLSFVDVSDQRGLKYRWLEQPRPITALDAFGAGCASFDGDDDGWQDILLVGNPVPVLFKNNAGIQFADVTPGSGLDTAKGRWTGCAIGDVDGDGRLDILLTGYHQLALFRNLGDWRFEDVTKSAGLDPTNQGFWGASAGFMDLDGDRWLDLVILNYVIYGPDTPKYCEYTPGVRSGCGPRTYSPEYGQIWRNTGQGGFQLVPAEKGMKATHGVGLVLAFTDLDQDGRQDFYIGNDGVPADLMLNRGDLRFENIATVAGVAMSDNGGAVSAMGADWADFDRDGILDLAVSNWHGLSFVIFKGQGQNLFVDYAKQTDLARASKQRLGFGTKWIDFENDGWPDLFFVNGHVYDNSAAIHGSGEPFRQAMCLFWNDQGRRVIDIVPRLGSDIQRPMVGRGSATIDFNNDGRVDLLAVDFEGPPVLLENKTASPQHWLKLELRGKTPNHFAYGARVIARQGDRVWLAEVSPTSSYLSSSDPRIHWGLGETQILDTVTIHWPAGQNTTLKNVTADQILKVTEDVP